MFIELHYLKFHSFSLLALVLCWSDNFKQKCGNNLECATKSFTISSKLPDIDFFEKKKLKWIGSFCLVPSK